MSQKIMYKHLFGPVPSRRLGMLLGIDLMLKKICSLNYVYCEVGKTTKLTLGRLKNITNNFQVENYWCFFFPSLLSSRVSRLAFYWQVQYHKMDMECCLYLQNLKEFF
jgi:hypothetical protein